MKINEFTKQDMKFLLVGCESGKEQDAMSEFWHVLIKYCGITPKEIFPLTIRGLFLVVVNQNPLDILLAAKQVNKEQLFTFKYCHNATPIEKIIKSTMANLSSHIDPFIQRIPQKAKWRIIINKRHTNLKRDEIINFIALHPNAPKGKVDLNNFDWCLLIEIFGEWLGLGVYNTTPIIKFIEGELFI